MVVTFLLNDCDGTDFSPSFPLVRAATQPLDRKNWIDHSLPLKRELSTTIWRACEKIHKFSLPRFSALIMLLARNGTRLR